MGTTAPAYPDRYFGGSTPSPVRPSGPNRGSPPIFWILLTILVVLCITWITCWILQTFGLESMLVFFIAISGAIWGWVIRWLYTDKRLTVSHILVIWMVWTGTILSGASYYLAYKGLTANLETLSRYIMVEVVAGVGGYFIKSSIENGIKIFRQHNMESDSESDDRGLDDDTITDL